MGEGETGDGLEYISDQVAQLFQCEKTPDREIKTSRAANPCDNLAMGCADCRRVHSRRGPKVPEGDVQKN